MARLTGIAPLNVEREDDTISRCWAAAYVRAAAASRVTAAMPRRVPHGRSGAASELIGTRSSARFTVALAIAASLR